MLPAAFTTPGADRTQLIVGRINAGFTLQEVATELGVTRERVRQVYGKATGHGTPRRGRVVRDAKASRTRRFWVNFAVDENGCWIWTASLYPTGYGHVKYGGDLYSHRAAYRLVKGPIPKGLTIDHLCRVKACGNPDHLEAVTQRVNTLRSPIAVAAINARKTHCKWGHAFTVENTYRTKRNERHCKACRRKPVVREAVA